MTPYRKKVVQCYYIMLSTQLLLAKSAFQIYMHFEVDELDKYIEEGYEFSREMLDNIKDPIVERINKFIYESDALIYEIEDRNLISEDDLDDGEDLAAIEDNGAAVRVKSYTGLVIFYLKLYASNRIEKAMKELSEIKNELPGADAAHAELYEDDNLKSIALFHAGLSELLIYLEKETDSIAEKRNW
jgi:hypothetical protein